MLEMSLKLVRGGGYYVASVALQVFSIDVALAKRMNKVSED